MEWRVRQPSTERDGNRWALLNITAPTLDPTAAYLFVTFTTPAIGRQRLTAV
jgi:hypothetical protein